MAGENTITFDKWLRGDAVEVGRTLMMGLAPAKQVACARLVLDLCRARFLPVEAVDQVSALAADPSRWVEAHAAFTAVRHLTLHEERAPTNAVYRALLFVAAIAAKIVYNASGAPAPFDADSAWWLASNARDLALAVGDESFTRQVWRALRHGRTMHARTPRTRR